MILPDLPPLNVENSICFYISFWKLPLASSPISFSLSRKKSVSHKSLKYCEMNSDIILNYYSGGHQDLQRSKTLNISFKSCSKFKSRDSFGNCSSWGFQNTPNMLKLIEFWLRYLRSKTNDMIQIIQIQGQFWKLRVLRIPKHPQHVKID